VRKSNSKGGKQRVRMVWAFNANEEIHCQKKLIIWSKQETGREGNQGNCGKEPRR